MLVELDDQNFDRIVVHSSPVQKDLVASIPGSRFQPGRRVWTVPMTWAACLALRGVFGDHLEIGPHLREAAAYDRDHFARMTQLKETLDPEVERRLRAKGLL